MKVPNARCIPMTCGPVGPSNGAWKSETLPHKIAKNRIPKGAETIGALAVGFVALLRICASLARRPGSTDSTVYGSSRSSPRSFFVHHLAAIAGSMLFYNSVAIHTAAAELSSQMTKGFCSGPIDWGRICSSHTNSDSLAHRAARDSSAAG